MGENYKNHHLGAAILFTVTSYSHLYAPKTTPIRHYYYNVPPRQFDADRQPHDYGHERGVNAGDDNTRDIMCENEWDVCGDKVSLAQHLPTAVWCPFGDIDLAMAEVLLNSLERTNLRTV